MCVLQVLKGHWYRWFPLCRYRRQSVTWRLHRCVAYQHSIIEMHLSSVPLSFCVGWTGNGGCAACFKCLWCRCKIRGSGVPEDVRSHIVVRTCEMMKVVVSATCSLKVRRNDASSLCFMVPHLRMTWFDMFRFHCDSRSYISLPARHWHIVVLWHSAKQVLPGCFGEWWGSSTILELQSSFMNTSWLLNLFP